MTPKHKEELNAINQKTNELRRLINSCRCDRLTLEYMLEYVKLRDAKKALKAKIKKERKTKGE